MSLVQFDFYPQTKSPPSLVFLGCRPVEKGPHLAIEIAKHSGWSLKMAGKIDFGNKEFSEHQVAPPMDGQQVEFLG